MKEDPENVNDSTMLFMGLALSAQKEIYALRMQQQGKDTQQAFKKAQSYNLQNMYK